MSHYRSPSSGSSFWLQQSNSPPVHQLNVLQELLFCFQGVDGNIMKIDGNARYSIREGVCLEQPQMIYHLLELGSLFNTVQRLLNAQQKCMVSNGLATEIQTKLNEYYMHVAELQKQERTDEGVDLVILTKVIPWARKKMLVLQFMIAILEETKHLMGGAILNPILRHLNHGNKSLRHHFESLFESASAPLYKMIWHWVVMGTIKDPNNEFFVTENIKYTRTKAWQCQFSLRHEYLPINLEGHCAQLILDVGKIMNFFNQFYPEKTTDLITEKQNLFSIERGDLNVFIAEDRRPTLELQRIYESNSELVLQAMKSKYRLDEFFIHVYEYVFLARGHFAHYLMELMQPFYYKTIPEVAPVKLKKALDKALKSCGRQPLDSFLLENIEIYYNESTEDDVIGDVFSLQYKMKGPIKIMLQICEMSYRKLFAFLWKKNHVLYTLTNTWKILRALCKMNFMPSDIKPGLHKLFAMNFQIIGFMNQLNYYMVFEVVEKNAKEFFEQFRTSKAIDDVVDAHARMLRLILVGILLDTPQMDLRTQLTNIFILVNDIEDLASSLSLYFESHDDSEIERLDEDAKHVINAKVEILIKNHQVAIENFIAFLKSCKHMDGLNAVCDRINFNEFYQLTV